MKFFLNTYLVLSIWLLSACSSFADDSDWQWKANLDKSIVAANNSTKEIEIGSYWNKEYRNAVFSISNLISTGWSNKHFDAEIYNAALMDVWGNPQNIRILDDGLVRLAALNWRINLKNRCVKSGVDTSMARDYFTEMLSSDENVIRNSAITGLGMIGDKPDVDVLLSLLVENQDSYTGNKALNSLLLVENDSAINGLKARLGEISNKSIKSKIKEELSYVRTHENKCNN